VEGIDVRLSWEWMGAKERTWGCRTLAGGNTEPEQEPEPETENIFH